MQASFQVGNVSLTFSPESSISIDDDLYINVWGMARPELGELWSGYESDDKVGFRLRFRDIHRAGVPTGEALFEAGRSSNFDHYLWDDGWDFALEFTGSAVIREGWLEMHGELAPQYQESPRAKVKLCWPVPLEGLDWTTYRFASLVETEGADPRWVTQLDLSDMDLDQLPARVLEFENLRSLRVRNLPLTTLAIAGLTQLEELQVYGGQLTHLPAAMGRLQALNWLQVSHCRLQSTPAELWSLPALRHLDLSHNQLTGLPESMQLPVLRNLDLADNQLTTLPESLAQLPRLKKLSLANNPLLSLPQVFAEFRLELPLADKMRLLDYSYPGAEPWDDSLYQADQLPPDCPEALGGLALRSIGLCHSQSPTEVGGTRFGGWPDLPVGQDYPRYVQDDSQYHYEFIAQLNCVELADLQGYLPRTGRLYFFLSNIHEMQPLVLYSESERLVDGSSLTLTADTFFDTWEVPYPGFATTITPFTSVPSSYSSRSNPHLFEGEAAAWAEEEEKLDQFRQQQSPSDSHEINSHVFTQHESPQLQAALRHRGHPNDWLILLKVASTGGFQWGDAGELFYVIHKSDLTRRDFSAVFCTCESS
ncbi:MAG: DUF1963 domain-containing protein [Candidatus Eremiobacteraeota bacterium]|nr:DUF1963 domain-containing protein [Candidatus Eremiobacteraeota bacterium]